ncbi:uncharacterized protein ARMOST_02320 [Armillaria ostoyae]|uniref:Uncharacterized protein n=1 Tax=Armillaria ostoyae TaxID=47428 RepID=A0A284QRG2_ARMOS|nr:uncharacterized protein ARMOST_02320 [Armillaria ostoyae]
MIVTTWIPFLLNHFVQAEGIEYRASSWCKFGIRETGLSSVAIGRNLYSNPEAAAALLNQNSNLSGIIGLLQTRSLELGSESTQVHPTVDDASVPIVSCRFLANVKGHLGERFFELLDRNEGWIRAIDSLPISTRHRIILGNIHLGDYDSESTPIVFYTLTSTHIEMNTRQRLERGLPRTQDARDTSGPRHGDIIKIRYTQARSLSSPVEL